MKRSGRLPYRSKGTSRTYRTQRVPLVAALLAANPVCARCMAARATDVHEVKSRARGGSILDEDNLVCLCRPCHSWITVNPKQATEEGWLRHSWE